MPRIAAALLTLSLASTALAQPESARELFQRGQAAYAAGDYATAADFWERAYGADPRPELQYNLAQAYERLGRLTDARVAYRTFIDASPSNEALLQTARARMASLEARLSRTGLVLEGGPENARVTIDGEDRGRLPRRDLFPLDPGTHRVVVSAAGYRDFTSTVAVPAGENVTVAVEMEPAGGGVSTAGVVVTVVGGVLLVTGGILGGLALARVGEATSPDDPQADQARTLGLVTDVLLITGAVAAGVGIVLMLVLNEGKAVETALLPFVGPDRAGLVARGTF